METVTVKRYLRALERGDFVHAYALLNDQGQAYFRKAANFASVYDADSYRIVAFALLGTLTGEAPGRVYFAREMARFRDHAHDAERRVTATVPIGVIPEHGAWRIKDPGHPWAAFATHATASAGGIEVSVKKVSFFERRIETIVTFTNAGPRSVTVLPYGRSELRDAAGRRYLPIETRDWTLTDRTLFEGLRLPPNARYTGMLAFACEPRSPAASVLTLTVGPLLLEGGDTPFSLEVGALGANPR